MTPVIAKIISMQPGFTVGENEIAQYVINNTDAIISSTISVVARDTGTSEASVNRFCKKLGYKGFNRLKVALAQESAYNQLSAQATGTGGGLLASISQDYQRILLNTTAMLDEADVLQIAETIKRANLVYVFGLTDTDNVAAEFSDKLSLVGIPSKHISELNSIRIACSHLRKGDFCVFLISSVFEKGLLPTVNQVKERGAQSLVITSYDAPQLSDNVDYKLVTSDIITAQNPVSISNNLIFMYVVDVLYAALLASDKGLREKKMNSDAIRNSRQNLDNYYYGY